MVWRSRRPVRQPPDRDDEGSTHVRTSFMGLTSSVGATIAGTLPTRLAAGQPVSGSDRQRGDDVMPLYTGEWQRSP